MRGARDNSGAMTSPYTLDSHTNIIGALLYFGKYLPVGGLKKVSGMSDDGGRMTKKICPKHVSQRKRPRPTHAQNGWVCPCNDVTVETDILTGDRNINYSFQPTNNDHFILATIEETASSIR